MKTFLPRVYTVCLIGFLFAAAPAHSETLATDKAPEVATIPTGLTENQTSSLRVRLAALKTLEDAFGVAMDGYNKTPRTGIVVGSPQQSNLNKQIKAVNKARLAYIAAVNEFNADVARLKTERIAELPRQIASDEEAIRRLGFQKRADEFTEWENFSRDKRDEYEQEVIQIIINLAIDEAASLAGKAGERKVAPLTKWDSNRWVKYLKSKNINWVWLNEKLAGFAVAKNRAERIVAVKVVMEGMGEAAKKAVEARPGAPKLELYKAVGETCLEFVGNHHSPQMRLLVAELELTSATVYESAAQNVSKYRIEKLTQMTEQQLKDQQVLLKVLQKHVKALQELKEPVSPKGATKFP